MRTLVFLLTLLFTSFTPRLMAQDFSDPLAYLEYITTEYDAFTEDLWNYVRTSSKSKNARKVESSRRQLLSTTSSIQKKIQRMPGFERDVTLRDSVAAYYGLVYHVLNEDYSKILDLEAIAEQSYDLMEAYLLAQELAQQKLNHAGDRVREQMSLFAAQNNINLIEGERSKTAELLDQANQAIGYYNRIYLLFFKSYKQEAYLMSALNDNDLKALIQNQNALRQFAGEGLATLDTLPDFNGDASLKEACSENMAFFHQEALEKVPIFSNFFLKKESFEKVKTAFEAKKQNDRTQEDVDRYNEAVGAYNAAVNDMNAAVEEVNQRRNELLDNWNKASEKFLNRHIP